MGTLIYKGILWQIAQLTEREFQENKSIIESKIKFEVISQARWCMPLIPAFRRERQEYLSRRPTWSIELGAGQPEPHRKKQSQKTNEVLKLEFTSLE